MSTIQELVVRAKPENLEETADSFTDMQSNLEETEEQMAESTDQFEEMQNRWSGALNSIVAGIAVGVGGLLSQVPVLGELVGSMASLIGAFAYQLDGVLRPILTPITNGIYELSAAVYEADGAFGALLGILGGVVSAVVSAAGAYLGWIAATQGFAAAASTVAGALSSLWGIITAGASIVAGIAAGITAATAAIAALVIAVAAFAIAYATNFKNVRTITNEVVGDILNKLGNLVTKGVNAAKGLWQGFKNWLGKALDGVENFVNEASDALTSLVDSAVEWGAQMIRNFIDGITSAAQGVGNFFDDLASGDIQAVGNAVTNITTGGGGGGGSRGFRAGSSRPQVIMNGKDLTENTGRYRRDMTSRRGRNG